MTVITRMTSVGMPMYFGKIPVYECLSNLRVTSDLNDIWRSFQLLNAFQLTIGRFILHVAYSAIRRSKASRLYRVYHSIVFQTLNSTTQC